MDDISTMEKHIRWTDDELYRMNELYNEGLPIDEIAKKINRSARAIEHKLWDKKKETCIKYRKIEELDEDEKNFLLSHFKDTKNDDLMMKLRINNVALHVFAREHHLTKCKEFMVQAQLNAAKAAHRSHIINGTYPPKGYIIPNRTHFFKKGESNKTRLSPERYAECQRKRRESWKKTFHHDKVRVLYYGLPQKTKLHIVPQSQAKLNYRYRFRKFGYIEAEDTTFIITNETQRKTKSEKNAIERFNFKFITK